MNLIEQTLTVLRLSQPKQCNNCNIMHLIAPINSTLYNGAIFFDCYCGATLAAKEKQNEAIQSR